jgi:hypothetical protein
MPKALRSSTLILYVRLTAVTQYTKSCLKEIEERGAGSRFLKFDRELITLLKTDLVLSNI